MRRTMTGIRREAKRGRGALCDSVVGAMLRAMSAIDPAEIARARALLKPAKSPERLWPVMSAAALLAISALGFATAMVLAPPLVSESLAER